MQIQMVDLARYDARLGAIEVEQDDPYIDPLTDPDTVGPSILDPVFNFIFNFFSNASAAFRQRRFRAVLKEYPRSLYCPSCGKIARKR